MRPLGTLGRLLALLALTAQLAAAALAPAFAAALAVDQVPICHADPDAPRPARHEDRLPCPACPFCLAMAAAHPAVAAAPPVLPSPPVARALWPATLPAARAPPHRPFTLFLSRAPPLPA